MVHILFRHLGSVIAGCPLLALLYVGISISYTAPMGFGRTYEKSKIAK
jgi:hypothetical protein